MSALEYQPLSREQIHLLMAPENEELERVWSRLTGALHGLVAVWSDTHPRPLYFYEDVDRLTVLEQPGRLRGTSLYEIAMHNVQSAAEIERLARERGHTPEVQAIIDRYVDTLLDEFDHMRLYPEIPPARVIDQEHGLAGEHRAAVGR
ncbi:MAG TPA: hypothetical protein VFT45_06375 [Longimicrobium sp.]|nr:hypothetical protein [Longimicrobium sp.]